VKIKLNIFLVLLAACSSLSLQAQNLITGGSFESPAVTSIASEATLPGWTWSGVGGGLVNCVNYFSSPAPDGDQACWLYGNTSISQIVIVPVAGQFDFSFVPFSPSPTEIQVTCDGSIVGDFIMPSALTFVVKESFSIPLVAGPHTLEIASNSTNSETSLFIDSVALVADSSGSVGGISSIDPLLSVYFYDGLDLSFGIFGVCLIFSWMEKAIGSDVEEL